jgi:serine phosphatase RsbU (regulator of sigma subunit)
MSMVPNLFPTRDGLDIYASMTPAKEVGGDMYGYLLQADLLYFCVGDVSGKGVPASLFMAQATRLFRTLATQQMMPAEIATRMNAALAENNEQGMFITMFIGMIDLSKKILYFANAGHNPPVIIDGDQVHFMEIEPNAPIGLWNEIDYVGEVYQNVNGKTLFLYTDGLNEAENLNKEQLGEERMLQLLRACSKMTAKQTVEKLDNDVEKHRNGADPNDDLTMLCLRVTEP